jgi:hypothetical protein
MIMGGKNFKYQASLACVVAIATATALFAENVFAATTSSIGMTSLVVRKVEGKTEDEIRRLVLQDSVYQNEIVETGLESASELRFADRTRISVGPNSSIVLDEFVYDPDPGEGTFALKVTEGVFRFVSGSMASSNYKIETPTVTVGVRGTVLVMVTRGDGAVAVMMESEDGVEVSNRNGDMVVLDKPGVATVAFADGTMTEPGPPPAWAMWRIREMDEVLATAGLPVPPPQQPEPQKQETEETEVTLAPPPPPLEVEPEPVDVGDPMRGLPRAEAMSGTGKPEFANSNAWTSETPGNGYGTADSIGSSGNNGNNGNNGNHGEGNNGQGKGNT